MIPKGKETGSRRKEQGTKKKEHGAERMEPGDRQKAKGKHVLLFFLIKYPFLLCTTGYINKFS